MKNNFLVSLVFLTILGLVSLVSLASSSLGDYIPQTGCWTYPDKVICLEPSLVNTTAFIKNVSCFSYDIYGTGSWFYPPCIANASLEKTQVKVCYKLMPIKNGEPDISGYNPNYNCHTETWEGNAQLKIPLGRIPWKCELESVDNYTKVCEIDVNKAYEISGIGNDVNGTKAILVTEMKEKPSYWLYVLAGIILLGILAIIYKKYKS